MSDTGKLLSEGTGGFIGEDSEIDSFVLSRPNIGPNTNPDKTEDCLWIGNCNSEVWSALKSLVERKKNCDAPIFVHGEVGTGKTTLLNTVGNVIKGKYPKLTVLHKTAADFKEEFLSATRVTNSLSDIFKFYSQVDFLLFDGIDELLGPASQVAFCSICTKLLQKRKSIVISSTKQISDLCEDFAPKPLAILTSAVQLELNTPDRTDVGEFLGWKASQCGITLVGIGRSTSPASLVCYVLGITDIDPLPEPFQLFERFINPHVMFFPGIDLDFDREGCKAAYRYLQHKFGTDHVARMAISPRRTNGIAIRDAFKAYGFCEESAKDLLEYIGYPEYAFKSLRYILEQGGPVLTWYNGASAIERKIFDVAASIEDTMLHQEIHSCAVLLSNRPLTDYIPMQVIRDEMTGEMEYVSQYDQVFRLGPVHLNLLMLHPLDIIREASEGLHHSGLLECSRPQSSVRGV